MSAIGTLVVTAAFSVGAVAAIRAVRRMGRNRRSLGDRARHQGEIIDLEADGASGVWRVESGPDRSGGNAPPGPSE